MKNWMHNRRPEADQGDHRGDGFAVVIGCAGTGYSCPNIAAVDRHIARLYRRIEESGPWVAEMVDELWTDIDLLLERRMFLALDLHIGGAA